MKYALVNHTDKEYIELCPKNDEKATIMYNSKYISSYLHSNMEKYITIVKNDSEIYGAVLKDYKNKTTYWLYDLIIHYYSDYPEDLVEVLMGVSGDYYKWIFKKLKKNKDEFYEIIKCIEQWKEAMIEYPEIHIGRLGKEGYNEILKKLEFLINYVIG